MLNNKSDFYEEIQKKIEAYLTGNWRLDKWSIKELNPNRKHRNSRHIHFKINNVILNNELKFAVKKAIENGWKVSNNHGNFISFMACIINNNKKITYSLMEKSVVYWEKAIQTEMSERGWKAYRKDQKYFSRKEGQFKVSKKSTHPHISRLRTLYKIIENLFNKNIAPWDLDKICPK